MTGVRVVASEGIARARRLWQSGDLSACEALCREVLEDDPENTEGWNLLGIVFCQAGRHEAGLSAFHRALLLDGGRADIRMNLGNALRESGDIERAEQCFREAIVLEPAYAQAHYNLGLALEGQGRSEAAAESYREALRIDPGFAEAYLNLGAVLEGAARKPEAEQCYRAALRCNPRLAGAWRALAVLLEEREQVEEAMDCCRKALEITPDDGRTLFMLGLLLERLGYTDEAASYVSRAMKRVAPPDAVQMSLMLATMVPPIMRSRDHIVQMRRQVEERLEVLSRARLRFDAEAATLSPPFFYSYHGLCNRALNTKLADLLLRMSPELAWAAPHCLQWRGPGPRIKVGFLSRFLRNHSIGRTTRGFFEQLDKSRFESFALFLPPSPMTTSRVLSGCMRIGPSSCPRTLRMRGRPSRGSASTCCSSRTW